MVVRTFDDLESEDNEADSPSTALTRYRVRPETGIAKRARILQERQVDSCCSCTRWSTCSTNLCECVAADRNCGNCKYKRNCANQPGWRENGAAGFRACQAAHEENEDTTSSTPSEAPTDVFIPPRTAPHPPPLHGVGGITVSRRGGRIFRG